MGMFDTYFPKKLKRCPRCRRKLDHWQGKDGPCLLFAWQEGVKHPIGFFPEDRLEPFADGEKATDTLPPAFSIYTSCPKHWIEAEGKASSGVWTETVVTRVVKLETWRRERIRKLNARLILRGLVKITKNKG